jgi:P2 family phage contractile tail tube protein
MLTLPKTLKGFTFVNNGNNLEALVTSIDLPNLKRKTEEYTAGALDGPIQIDVGGEIMELELVLAEINGPIVGVFNMAAVDTEKFRVKGSRGVEGDIKEEKIDIICRGRWVEIDFGTMEPHKPGETKYKCILTYYELRLADKPIVIIDTLAAVHIGADGKDRLAERRANLGI